MQHKDLGIVLDTARTYGIPVPVTGVIHQLFTAMLEQGNRELDNSAIITVYESLAHIHLDEPDK
jgi:2-hydroxy-3-oxopropionate reductase